MYKLAKIGIDDIIQGEAYIDENVTWNGWLCPVFTAEQAKNIMEQIITNYDCFDIPKYNIYEDDDLITYYDENEGLSIIVTGVDIETEEDGIQHGFPIGSYSWIWSEIE